MPITWWHSKTPAMHWECVFYRNNLFRKECPMSWRVSKMQRTNPTVIYYLIFTRQPPKSCAYEPIFYPRRNLSGCISNQINTAVREATCSVLTIMLLQTPNISPLLRDVSPQQLVANIDPSVVQNILASPPGFDDQAFLRQRFGDALAN